MALPRYILERKQEVDALDLRPGQYQQPTVKNSDVWCVVGCPKCGTLCMVLRHMHSVNWVGDVSPGVTCPSKCGLQASLYLEGWIPEAKGQA